MPKEKWVQVNHMLVGFGQTVCKPIGPQCWRCGIKDLCPYKPKSKDPGSKKRQRDIEETDAEEDYEKQAAASNVKPSVVKTRAQATSKRVKK